MDGKQKKQTLVASLVFGAALSVSIAPAHAGTIGIDFGGSFTSSAQPGIVPGGNWNNVPGASLTLPLTLMDNSGSGTSAVLTFSAAFAYGLFTEPTTANSDTNALYTHGIGGDPTGCCEVSITIADIPYSEYDVYVYASSDSLATNTLSVSDGATTFYYEGNGEVNAEATSLLLTTSTNPESPTAGPAQYQIFADNTSSSFTVATGGSEENVLSNNVFGVEIVQDPSPAPEPATCFTFASALGLIGLLARRSIASRRQP
jgi:hypothetical protein